MTDLKKRKLRLAKHALDVATIGKSALCPLNSSAISDFIPWLRLVSKKFEYRMLYCDLTTCVSFILLIAASVRFHAVLFPGKLFYALTMLALIGCCTLFIGIHLIQHREPELKAQAKSLVINWSKYRRFISGWGDRFMFYVIAIVLYSIAYLLYAQANSLLISATFMLSASILFAYGIRFLISTIRAKENTQIYVMQALIIKNQHSAS